MNNPNQASKIPARGSRWAKLQTAFVTGLFLLAPLGVCVFVINFLLVNVGDRASDVFFGWMGWLQGPVANSPLLSLVLSVVSIIIVVALITTLGLASHYFFGRWLLRRSEKLILRVPILNQVYRTTKQIVDTFHTQQGDGFDKVVLVEFPRQGVYSIGFVTKPVEGEMRARTSDVFVNVFIPTTPLPTNGFLVMVREHELIRLDMSVGDGMKLIISGGTITPPYPASTKLEKKNS